MDDQAKVAALDIARDLEGELGGGIVTEMRDENKTRAFGLSQAAAIAGLILRGGQITLQFPSDRKISELEAHLNAKLPTPEKVSPATRQHHRQGAGEIFRVRAKSVITPRIISA